MPDFLLHGCLTFIVNLCLRLTTVTRTLLLLALATALCWAGEAGRLFKQARKAEKAGKYAEAYLLYSQARALNPTRDQFIFAAEGVRVRATQAMAAAAQMDAIPSLGSASAYLLQSARTPPPAVLKPISRSEEEEVRRLRPPVELRPEIRRTDFRLKGSIQEIYEKVAREFGLDVLFDSDYQGSQQIRFELSGCDFLQAILALNDVADSFIVPVSPKLFLVAADSTQKRAELEPVVAVLQPLPDLVTPEELTELAQAVQQSLEMKRLQIDPARRQVFMRDTVTRVRLARAMFEHLAKPKAELVLDVELISVSDSDRLRLGLGLPSAFPVINLSTIWNNQPSVPDTITSLLGIGGGQTVFGLAIGAANLVANRLTAESRLVSHSRLRASNNTPATLHVGERYPIINARFSPIAVDDDTQGAIDDGTFVEPVPSFTFEELGLVLEMTPQIHNAREVSVQFNVQFRVLTGSTANDIPVIANREFNSFARLQEGEVAVIGGIALAQTFKVRTGVVGLSEIPLLGNLFKRYTREKLNSDLIVLVRPYVVRLPPAEAGSTLTLMYGPEQRPLSGF
jgi:hypothetical protein